jgi:hypothetical protein
LGSIALSMLPFVPGKSKSNVPAFMRTPSMM